MFSLRAVAARRSPAVFMQRAAFSQSIARCAGKESALSTSTRLAALVAPIASQGAIWR
jgi:hypothetical protein